MNNNIRIIKHLSESYPKYFTPCENFHSLDLDHEYQKDLVYMIEEKNPILDLLVKLWVQEGLCSYIDNPTIKALLDSMIKENNLAAKKAGFQGSATVIRKEDKEKI